MCLYQWILLLSGTPRLRNDLLCIKLDVNLYILDGLLMFKCLILKIYVCTRAVSVMASWGHWLCMKFLTTFEVQTAATREQIIFNFNGYYVLWHNSLLFIQELRWLWPLILNEKCDRYSCDVNTEIWRRTVFDNSKNINLLWLQLHLWLLCAYWNRLLESYLYWTDRTTHNQYQQLQYTVLVSVAGNLHPLSVCTNQEKPMCNWSDIHSLLGLCRIWLFQIRLEPDLARFTCMCSVWNSSPTFPLLQPKSISPQ